MRGASAWLALGISLQAMAGGVLTMPPPPGTTARSASTPPPPKTDAPVKAPPPATEPPPSALLTPTGEKPRLFVTALEAQGVTPAEAAAFTDAISSTLQDRNVFSVITGKEVELIIKQERNRQLIGECETSPESCGANLGAVIGARYVVTGSLAKVGTVYELSVQTVDTLKVQRLGRGTRLSKDLTTLRLLLPYVVAEATGTPLPPPAPRYMQFAMIATGGAALIAGGTLGMIALGRASSLNDELCPTAPIDVNNDDSGQVDSCQGTNLRPREFYVAQNNQIGAQKTAALALMVVGAGLAAAGIYLMPPPEGGPRVAIVPSVRGVAVVGVFP